MKSVENLSKVQKTLIGGLKLLKLPKDNIIMVGLMLKSESQLIEMIEWQYRNFKKNKTPTKEEEMDMAQYIMQSKEKGKS